MPADSADWINDVAGEQAPQALICLDAFHVVKWAEDRLDELRRRLAGELRARGKGDQAISLGKGMWALRKNPAGLSPGQRRSLAQIAADNKQLYKACLMNEQLREVSKVKGERGKALLAGLISWCQRSRIPESTALARTLKRFRQLEHPRPRCQQRAGRGHRHPARRPHRPGPGASTAPEPSSPWPNSPAAGYARTITKTDDHGNGRRACGRGGDRIRRMGGRRLVHLPGAGPGPR